MGFQHSWGDTYNIQHIRVLSADTCSLIFLGTSRGESSEFGTGATSHYLMHDGESELAVRAMEEPALLSLRERREMSVGEPAPPGFASGGGDVRAATGRSAAVLMSEEALQHEQAQAEGLRVEGAARGRKQDRWASVCYEEALFCPWAPKSIRIRTLTSPDHPQARA